MPLDAQCSRPSRTCLNCVGSFRIRTCIHLRSHAFPCRFPMTICLSLHLTGFCTIGRTGAKALRYWIALAGFFFTVSAHSGAYPEKPVRFIVAYPAGGSADLVARLVGQKLADSLQQPFVIDNRGGAGGVIGEELAAKSAPDGYTILLISISHVVNPHLNQKLAYDPMKDLVPVSLLVSVPNVLVVHNTLPVKSVPDLISLAKSKPGQLNYASSIGTSLHLAGELFRTMADVNIVAVNFKGGGLAAADLQTGRVQMSFAVFQTAQSLLKSGRLHAVAITSAKRSQLLPDVPTIAESLPGYELTGWLGIVAPAGTAPVIVNQLSSEIAAILRAPDAQSRVFSLGAEPIGSTPEQFAQFRKTESAKIARLLSRVNKKTEGIR
jgi:tripartite-type tricarboxylate transporter receptor subunit TctC